MQFLHNFTGIKQDELTYFALCYPFSYSDCNQKFDELQERLKDSKTIYFHQEDAVHSIEGRTMKLITISSFDGISNEREDLLPNLFPSHNGDRDQRPFR